MEGKSILHKVARQVGQTLVLERAFHHWMEEMEKQGKLPRPVLYRRSVDISPWQSEPVRNADRFAKYTHIHPTCHPQRSMMTGGLCGYWQMPSSSNELDIETPDPEESIPCPEWPVRQPVEVE